MKSVILYVIDSSGNVVPFENTSQVINANGQVISPSTEDKQNDIITELQRLDTSTVEGVVAIIGNDNLEENYIISSPTASTSYDQDITMDGFGSGTIYIIADQAIDVELQITFDGGATYTPIKDRKITNTNFSTTEANEMSIPKEIAFRIKYTTGSTPPTDIKTKVIKKVV